MRGWEEQTDATREGTPVFLINKLAIDSAAAKYTPWEIQTFSSSATRYFRQYYLPVWITGNHQHLIWCSLSPDMKLSYWHSLSGIQTAPSQERGKPLLFLDIYSHNIFLFRFFLPLYQLRLTDIFPPLGGNPRLVSLFLKINLETRKAPWRTAASSMQNVETISAPHKTSWASGTGWKI